MIWNYHNKNNNISQEFDAKRFWLIMPTWSSDEQNFDRFVAGFMAKTLREKFSKENFDESLAICQLCQIFLLWLLYKWLSVTAKYYHRLSYRDNKKIVKRLWDTTIDHQKFLETIIQLEETMTDYERIQQISRTSIEYYRDHKTQNTLTVTITPITHFTTNYERL